jgi:hypothetical protein
MREGEVVMPNVQEKTIIINERTTKESLSLHLPKKATRNTKHRKCRDHPARDNRNHETKGQQRGARTCDETLTTSKQARSGLTQ